MGWQQSGSIVNSSASGDVSCVCNFGNVGGLVGYQEHSTILGSSGNPGIIVSSFASGNVNSSNNVGGLVGVQRGSIASSSAIGNVNGNNYVGGLVGIKVGILVVVLLVGM